VYHFPMLYFLMIAFDCNGILYAPMDDNLANLHNFIYDASFKTLGAKELRESKSPSSPERSPTRRVQRQTWFKNTHGSISELKLENAVNQHWERSNFAYASIVQALLMTKNILHIGSRHADKEVY